MIHIILQKLNYYFPFENKNALNDHNVHNEDGNMIINVRIIYGSIKLKSKLLKASFQIFVKAEATRSFISGVTTGNPTLHEAFIIRSKTLSIKNQNTNIFIISIYK